MLAHRFGFVKTGSIAEKVKTCWSGLEFYLASLKSSKEQLNIAKCPFCQLVILSTDHFANWSFCQLVILLIDHFVNWLFCQ